MRNINLRRLVGKTSAAGDKDLHMLYAEICAAIQSQHLITFHYSATTDPGYRTVEPHMIASSLTGNLTLSAWFLRGASASNEGPGWRQYLLSDISNVTVLPDTFLGPRFGYKPDGGRTFHNVRCAL